MFISATPEISDGVVVYTPEIETECNMDLENMAADYVAKDLIFDTITKDATPQTISYKGSGYVYTAHLVPIATVTSTSLSASSASNAGRTLFRSSQTALLLGFNFTAVIVDVLVNLAMDLEGKWK